MQLEIRALIKQEVFTIHKNKIIECKVVSIRVYEVETIYTLSLSTSVSNIKRPEAEIFTSKQELRSSL